MKLKQYLLNKITFCFEQFEDFNHGRHFIGKFTSLNGEINTLLLVTIGWDALKAKAGDLFYIILGGLIFLYLFGKFYRRSDALETEERAVTNRNPLAKIKLRASEIVIARFGGKQEYEKDIRVRIERETKRKL